MKKSRQTDLDIREKFTFPKVTDQKNSEILIANFCC